MADSPKPMSMQTAQTIAREVLKMQNAIYDGQSKSVRVGKTDAFRNGDLVEYGKKSDRKQAYAFICEDHVVLATIGVDGYLYPVEETPINIATSMGMTRA